MAAKKPEKIGDRPRRPPATTPEGREQQLQAMAYDLAERQILDGTVSAQVLTYFLKSTSIREKLELENLRKDNLLRQARVDQIQSGAKTEVLLEKAMRAFSEYSGQEVVDEE